jgi:hypothetical protein
VALLLLPLLPPFAPVEEVLLPPRPLLNFAAEVGRVLPPETLLLVPGATLSLLSLLFVAVRRASNVVADTVEATPGALN